MEIVRLSIIKERLFACFQKNNMSARAFLKNIFKRFGYKVSKYAEGDIDADTVFIELYEQCRPYTKVARERCYALYLAVRYAVAHSTMGDMVECGVWKGGCSMLIAHTLLTLNDTSRTIWLYDTFEGMSEPTTDDISTNSGIDAVKEWNKHNRTDGDFWCEASLEEVRNNMNRTGYPPERIKFVKGKVEDTIPMTVPVAIALLRLDTDWYESTYHEMKYLYPLISNGGTLVLDDYGSWNGARKAVDQYLHESHTPLLLVKTHNGRVGVKVS